MATGKEEWAQRRKAGWGALGGYSTWARAPRGNRKTGGQKLENFESKLEIFESNSENSESNSDNFESKLENFELKLARSESKGRSAFYFQTGRLPGRNWNWHLVVKSWTKVVKSCTQVVKSWTKVVKNWTQVVKILKAAGIARPARIRVYTRRRPQGGCRGRFPTARILPSR